MVSSLTGRPDKRERENLLEWSASLEAVERLPASAIADVHQALALARRFNREVVAPLHLELDARIQDDPEYLPWGFIHEANRWRLFSRWLPALFGGGGWNTLSLYVFLEEVSSVCVALANVIGVHYLGVATVTSSANTALMERLFSDVRAGERSGKPCLISLAITEPGAGTDVEEVELLERARIGTCATRQADGSYLLNGRKVFISNGHVSTWHMVISYEDRKRPDETMVMLAVHKDTPGFSTGAKERKMGQKACVASELIFEDCPVPANQVAAEQTISRKLGIHHREASQLVIDFVVSTTRAGVGAFATGIARGAFETARDHVLKENTDQGPLIERQWVQTRLAEMAANARIARQSYLESACANSLAGLFHMLFAPGVRHAERYLPADLYHGVSRFALRHPLTARLARQKFGADYPKEWQLHTSAMASMAKVVCSDLAVTNSDLALELVGPDGLRHELGIEKRIRDAKLLQIYEGTNQLNRLNLFKCQLASASGTRVFVREEVS